MTFWAFIIGALMAVLSFILLYAILRGPDRPRQSGSQSSVVDNSGVREELTRANVEIAALREILYESRIILRQIEETTTSGDDRLLAGRQAERIGESLLDLMQRREDDTA